MPFSQSFIIDFGHFYDGEVFAIMTMEDGTVIAFHGESYICVGGFVDDAVPNSGTFCDND